MNIAKKVWLSILLLSSLTIQAQLNVTTGDKYKVVSTMDMKMTQKVMGQDMEINTKSEGENTASIGDKKDGKFQCLFTTDALKINSSVMDEEMVYNSKNPAENQGPVENLNGMLKVKTTFLITEQGKIEGIKNNMKEIDGLEEMASMPGMDLSGAQVRKISAPVGFATHAIGESWKESYDDETGKGEVEYKVVSKDKDFVTLAYVAKGFMEKDVQNKGMEIHISMNVNRKGENKYNLSSGIIVSGEESAAMDGNAELKSMGMKIPNTSSYTSRITVTKQ